MGAVDFVTRVRAKTAREAFLKAIDEARHEYGHRGYTGSIAEKNDFRMIALPDDTTPTDHAYDLLDAGDPRIDDKWGPAGCIEVKEHDDGTTTFLFFGIASC
jgi:hypothetical protein